MTNEPASRRSRQDALQHASGDLEGLQDDAVVEPAPEFEAGRAPAPTESIADSEVVQEDVVQEAADHWWDSSDPGDELPEPGQSQQ